MVIGGGITGLSAALRLHEIDPAANVTLVESSDRLGGVLQTVERDGFLIERGADNFITNMPGALELCRHVGLAEDELVSTNQRLRQAYVVRHGRLHRIPAGFVLMVPQRIWPVLFTGLLSPWGKLRLLGEYFIPARADGGDESLASFAQRRLGREAFERLVQPLVGGIYTADAEKLSLAATMPRFLEMERTCGGLLRGRRFAQQAPGEAGDAQSSGARYSQFMTPRGGLSSLVRACAARLPAGSIRLGSRATSLEQRPGSGWSVVLSALGQADVSLECDALIVALPAPAAARLLAGASAELAAQLACIPYAGAAVVSMGFRREQIRHPLAGFGFVVPATECRSILAASFSSVKFPARAPAGCVLIRSFVGGACSAGTGRTRRCQPARHGPAGTGRIDRTRGAPLVCDIARWPGSMAQYHLGHIELVERIERLAAGLPGLALAGNAYHGVGISQCVRSGQRAAERVLAVEE